MNVGRPSGFQVVLWGVTFAFITNQAAMSSDGSRDELTKLQGSWLVQSSEFGGKKSPAEGELIWKIVGDQLTQRFGPEKEVFRLELYPSSRPKGVDVLQFEPKDGARAERVVTRTKCIYALDGDELKVGYTARFLPGTPEDEERRANENANIRPTTFDTKRGDVLVITLKRQQPTKGAE